MEPLLLLFTFSSANLVLKLQPGHYQDTIWVSQGSLRTSVSTPPCCVVLTKRRCCQKAENNDRLE